MKTLRHELHANIVLGVGAHADDLDFTAAGTVARLASEGSEVYYLVLTDGGKGSAESDITPARLAGLRRDEQRAAAKLLGVREVFFLDYEDGALEVTQELKRDIVRHIRMLKPDVMIAFDPTMVYYTLEQFINHPDHRACGQAVLDAAFPLARDHLTYPDLIGEGMEPHKVRTLLLTNFEKQHYYVDIGSSLDTKIAALAAHASQVGDMSDARQWVEEHARRAGERGGCQFAEAFVRLDIKA